MSIFGGALIFRLRLTTDHQERRTAGAGAVRREGPQQLLTVHAGEVGHNIYLWRCYVGLTPDAAMANS